jgi:hypothetical protein
LPKSETREKKTQTDTDNLKTQCNSHRNYAAITMFPQILSLNNPPTPKTKKKKRKKKKKVAEFSADFETLEVGEE